MPIASAVPQHCICQLSTQILTKVSVPVRASRRTRGEAFVARVPAFTRGWTAGIDAVSRTGSARARAAGESQHVSRIGVTIPSALRRCSFPSMRSRSIIMAAVLPVLGCGSASSNDSEASTPPPELGAIITLASENLRPGDKVSATFPASDLRGGFFYLYAWQDGEWSGPRFLLESDANGNAPRVVPMDQGMSDYGIGGPGPDGLILPSDIAPGSWRICTANARENVCGQFTVEQG